MKKTLHSAAAMPGKSAASFPKYLPVRGFLYLLSLLLFLAVTNKAMATDGTGVVSSVTGNGGSCISLTTASGNGPDNWEVVEGGSYTMTITGVTECSGSTITVFIQNAQTGNFCFNAVGGSGTYVGSFTMASPTCATSPISYKCGGDQACDNSDAFAADGPSHNNKVHLRSSSFDGNCVKIATDENCNPTEPQCNISVTGIKTNIACHGDNNGSIDITVSGAQGNVTYLWSDGSTDGDRTNLAPGPYAVTVTDDEGCTSNEAFIIIEPFVLGLSGNVINVTTTNGSDGSIDITVTGGTFPYSFLWSDGSTDEDRTNLPAGDYSVTITDFNGCQYTQTFTEDEPECSVSVTGIKVDITCHGDNNGSIDITVSGAQGIVTYLWSDGSTDEDRTNLAPGFYSVTVTDDASCSSGETFEITEPAALSISPIVIDETTVNGSNGSIDITVTGGTSPYTYLWNDGSTDEDRTNLAPGTYSVTVTDDHGCGISAEFEIKKYECTLTVDAGPDDSKCKGKDFMLSASSSDQNATYSWSPQTGLDNPNIANPITSVKNNTTYTVTVAGADGCSASDEVTVTVNPVVKAKITAVANDGGCGAPCVKLSTPYNANWSYKWKLNGQNAPAPNTVNTYCACASGVYSVKVKDINTGCQHNSKKYTVTITQKMEAGQTITEGAALYFNVWPNPTSDLLNVTINHLSEGATTIRLLDMFGRVIATADAGAEGQTITFNMNDLASGVYFVRMESGNFKEVQKVLLAK